MEGYIHSFESFGTKDGPGIRFVLFMQGCPLRCLYCHNPDTWNIHNHKYKISPQEAFDEVWKVKSFIRNGGVTISGGEPFLQCDFILEFFKLCKQNQIHTAIDTSGYILNDMVKNVLEYTDLVLLDVKHIDPIRYKQITSRSLEPTLHFLNYLQEINKPVWLRYVLVPDLTNDIEDIHRWAKYVSNFNNIIERVDVLPFHQMGIHKWEEANIKYSLKNTPTPSKEEVENVEQIFKSYNLPIIT